MTDHNEAIDVDVLSGAQIAPFLDQLAQLRLTVFREWPYLYEGDLDYERDYLRVYLQSLQSVFVLARLAGSGKVIGCATGIPLADESADIRGEFDRVGIDTAKIFYFGESVLLGDYRGRGLGHRFFDGREGHAASLGGFSHTVFCAVDRATDDPRRPPGARDLGGFWGQRGYRRHPHLAAHISWPELGSVESKPHRLSIWSRPLDGHRAEWE